MAAKKKLKKKTSVPSPRRALVKKTAREKTPPKKSFPKKSANAQAARAKRAVKGKAARKSTASRSTKTAMDRSQRKRRLGESQLPSLRGKLATSGGQSGDLQGLSNVEAADSESVDELLEEGNSFEAGIVTGVEDAGNAEGKEVHTREVPEDDVPEEYLDEE